MVERIRFATSLDDPRLEADLLPRAMSKRALVFAGGGCSALTLALRYPDVAFTAFDPDPAQIAHVRAKMEASERRDLARLNVGDDAVDGLNACGAMEAIFSLQMMRDGFLAPNRNLDEVDPRCAKLGYVREVMHAKPRLIMTNNFAFGGVNTSIILKKLAD